MNDKESVAPKDRKIKRKTKLLIIGGIVVAIIAVFAGKAIIDAPRDLGPDLVYVGQYGNFQNNPILYIIPFSDSGPYVDYYFGTNMSIEQLRLLITKAGFSYDDASSGEAAGSGTSYFVLSFIPNRYSPNGLSINEYDAHSSVFYDRDSNVNYIRTNKKYVLEIPDHNYRELRQALQSAKLLGK